tara:strand:- start:359 stop:592 length:234 start_codon:yes stop_codon:yes gene_type:complete
MQIKPKENYKVVKEFNIFPEDTNEEGQIFFEGEIYKLDFLFERNGVPFVHLILQNESNGSEINRSVGLAMFKECFSD